MKAPKGYENWQLMQWEKMTPELRERVMEIHEEDQREGTYRVAIFGRTQAAREWIEKQIPFYLGRATFSGKDQLAVLPDFSGPADWADSHAAQLSVALQPIIITSGDIYLGWEKGVL